MQIMLATNYKIGFFIIQIITSIAEKSSTTTSHVNSDDILRNLKSPRSKFYYYFAPRSYDNESPESIERGEYDTHYQGYQAQWPSVVQQPVHVHHTVPYKEKDNDDKHSYLLPLLLLAALLPFLLGAIVLLPLLATFFTNILQLLALMQQTMLNATNGGLGTNVGRKRRNLQGVHPFLTTTVMSLVENFSSALEKYDEKSN